ncbi:unnamed protein product [Linum trigynum]|uniref:RING-type domain-containing protein n=1 Tax=Linum trigynum TaxID=586398 RepID=A0AAV2GDI4_9ROSI
MAISVVVLLLLLLLLHQSISLSTSSSPPSPPRQDCKISTCTGRGSIPVRFPFRLAGRQPRTCGYTPGFDLRCDAQGQTAFQLPLTAGDFAVRSVDYLTRRVWINDPDNCLPKRILTLDLAGSPFSAAFYHNYTFLRCPTQLVRSRFTTVACLSNSTTSVLATSSSGFVGFMTATASCEVAGTVRVPASWPVPFSDGSSTALDDDVMLVWDSPDCTDCESRGGSCGFKNNATRVIGCSGVGSASALKVLKVLSLSLAIPAAACATGIACFAFFIGWGRRGATTMTINSGHRNPATAVVPEPVPAMVTVGLDEAIIESYEKVVLGESKRVPGPNDTACAICLTEYCSKDTIRLIPECKHCFHAECIDEWLRMNTTCPVCRNSPSSPSNAAHAAGGNPGGDTTV